MEEQAREEARLASLHSLKILDTDVDEAFDQVTRLLETQLRVPIVLVSLVDRDRQWFKSCIGLDVRETSREVSFCSDAIKGDQMYVVYDASADPRYCNNSLVQGNPMIRFYAGKPIRGLGKEKIGTICVIDRKPRVLSHDQRQLLEICANFIESEIKKFYFESQIRAIEESQIVVEFNMDGTINQANRTFLDLMGYKTPDEVRGKPHHVFWDYRDEEGCEAFWNVLNSGTFQQGEFKRIGKNGKEVWIQATYTPILDINGIPVKVIKYAVDVTTQKIQSKQIERYCRQLELNEKKMNNISAVISHDLINSLAPIVSLTQLLLCDTINPGELRDLELIHQSACDALSLTRDLFDANKLDLSQLEVHKKAVKVTKLLASYSGRNNITVELMVDTEACLCVDRQRIEQVLSNLVLNAEDFATSVVVITVKQISDDFVQFSVHDDGIGIPKEKRGLLFQQFGENIHENVRRRKPRTGLGLFICKRLIELHGGSIWLDETTSVGAQFCFTLPVAID